MPVRKMIRVFAGSTDGIGLPANAGLGKVGSDGNK